MCALLIYTSSLKWHSSSQKAKNVGWCWAHMNVRHDQFLLSSIVATEILTAYTNFAEIDIKPFLMKRDCVRYGHSGNVEFCQRRRACRQPYRIKEYVSNKRY